MKVLANWIYALIGLLLAVGSAINEGVVLGAWAGVAYALAFGIIIGFGVKLMRGIAWKDSGMRIDFCVAGGVVASLVAMLF